MMYAVKETKSICTDIPYIPKPLDLPIPIVKQSSLPSQSEMTSNEEEEDFIKNNYVARTLLKEPELAPITWSNWYKEVHWPISTVLVSEPFIALYGIYTTSFMWQTAAFSFF